MVQFGPTQTVACCPPQLSIQPLNKANMEERERGIGGGEHSCHSAAHNQSTSTWRRRHL